MTQEFFRRIPGSSGYPPQNNDPRSGVASVGIGGCSTFGGGAISEQQHSSGGGGSVVPSEMDMTLDHLPIRKRYLKSHGVYETDAKIEAGGANSRHPDSTPPVANFSSTLQAVSAFCSGGVGGDLEARLRAGVIRHSSDPKRCLAYYYNNKSCSWQLPIVVSLSFITCDYSVTKFILYNILNNFSQSLRNVCYFWQGQRQSFSL
jgi:hypothetical protein